jgi:hypothetical protein
MAMVVVVFETGREARAGGTCERGFVIENKERERDAAGVVREEGDGV